MLSVSTPGRHFFRPSRCLACRLQGLGLARAPQRAFFNSPDNVAPSVLRLVAEAGQPGLTGMPASHPFRGVVVDIGPVIILRWPLPRSSREAQYFGGPIRFKPKTTEASGITDEHCSRSPPTYSSGRVPPCIQSSGRSSLRFRPGYGAYELQDVQCLFCLEYVPNGI